MRFCLDALGDCRRGPGSGVALLLGLWFITTSLAAAEIQVQLTPVADTTLYEPSPTNNLGRVTELPAGGHNGAKRSRFLVRFQPESYLPPAAAIVSVELNLIITTANPGPVHYGLHRMLTSWHEGNKEGNNGAPATAGESTWLARAHPDNLWPTPGGASGSDYVAEASVVQVFDGANTNVTLSSPALTAEVQRWLQNPGTNFGWMLRAVDESVSQTVRRIVSREGTTNAPSLTLRYQVGPELRVNVTAGFLTLAFDAAANRTYAVESRARLDVGSWETRTNFPPLTVSGTLMFSEGTDQASRIYRVREQ